MGRQVSMKGIRYKEVCVLRIGLMPVYYLMYFYDLLLFVIHMLSLDKLGDLPTYLNQSMRRCISAGLLYTCQPVVLWIGIWFPNLATTGDTASCVGLTEIVTSYGI